MLHLWKRCITFFILFSTKLPRLNECHSDYYFLEKLVQSTLNGIQKLNFPLPTWIVESNLSIYIALPLVLKPKFFDVAFESVSKIHASGSSILPRPTLSLQLGSSILSLDFTAIHNLKLFSLCFNCFDVPSDCFTPFLKNYFSLVLQPMSVLQQQEKRVDLQLEILQTLFMKDKDIFNESNSDLTWFSHLLTFLKQTLVADPSPNRIYKVSKLFIPTLEFGFRSLKSKFNFNAFSDDFIPWILTFLMKLHRVPTLSTTVEETSYIPKLLDIMVIYFDSSLESKEKFLDRAINVVKHTYIRFQGQLGEPSMDTLEQHVNSVTLPLPLLLFKLGQFFFHFIHDPCLKSNFLDEPFFQSQISLFFHFFVHIDLDSLNQWVIYHYDVCVQIVSQLVMFTTALSHFNQVTLCLPQALYDNLFERLLMACTLPIHLTPPSNSNASFIQILLVDKRKLPRKSKSFLKQTSASLLCGILKSGRPVPSLLLEHLSTLLSVSSEIGKSSSDPNILRPYIRLWCILSSMPLVRGEIRDFRINLLDELLYSSLNNPHFLYHKRDSFFLLDILKHLTVDPVLFSHLSHKFTEVILKRLLENGPLDQLTTSGIPLLNCLQLFFPSTLCQMILLDYVSDLIPWLSTFYSHSQQKNTFLLYWIKTTSKPFLLLYHLCFEWLWEEEINETYLSELLKKESLSKFWSALFLSPPSSFFFDLLTPSEIAIYSSMVTFKHISLDKLEVNFTPISHPFSDHTWVYVSSCHLATIKIKICKHCWTSLSDVFKAMFTQGWKETYMNQIDLEFYTAEVIEDLNCFGFQLMSLSDWWIHHALSLTEGFQRLTSLFQFLHCYLCSSLFLHVFQQWIGLLRPKGKAFQALYHYFKQRNPVYKNKHIFCQQFYQALLQPDLLNFSKVWYIHNEACFDMLMHHLALNYLWFYDTEIPEKEGLQEQIYSYIEKKCTSSTHPT